MDDMFTLFLTLEQKVMLRCVLEQVIQESQFKRDNCEDQLERFPERADYLNDHIKWLSQKEDVLTQIVKVLRPTRKMLRPTR